MSKGKIYPMNPLCTVSGLSADQWPSLKPENRTEAHHEALKWLALNEPKMRHWSGIPDNPYLQSEFAIVCPNPNYESVFPTAAQHLKACGILEVEPAIIFKVKPAAKLRHFRRGISLTVLDDLRKFDLSIPHVSLNTLLTVTEWLYSHCHSYPRKLAPNSTMFIVEFSIGMLSKQTGFSEPTVKRCLSFLRSKFFIHRIHRGYPDAHNVRYQHSWYEIPKSLKHIQAWRIHKRKHFDRSPSK
jgi:hypothetical protein